MSEVEVSVIVSHPKLGGYVGSIAITPCGKHLYRTWDLSNQWEECEWQSASNNCRYILHQASLTNAKTYRGIFKIKVPEGS